MKKQQQPETCTVINDTSQGIVATWFRTSGIFTNTLLHIYSWDGLERILKISRYLAKLWVSKLIASSTMCVGALSCWKTKNSL